MLELVCSYSLLALDSRLPPAPAAPKAAGFGAAGRSAPREGGAGSRRSSGLKPSAASPEPDGSSKPRGLGTTRTLKLTIAYEGAGFVGWQRQAEGTSIQGLIEAALSAIEGSTVAVTGAGRTDAGAHALGQVASFHLSHFIDPETLRRALNAILPGEVRVVRAEEAPVDFHARSRRSQDLPVLVLNGEFTSPFERRYVWHVPQRLRVDAMYEAARLFEGRHDFRAVQAAGSSATTTTRTVFSCILRDEAPGVRYWEPWAAPPGGRSPAARLLICEITGDGFLRHMVRTIVGTLVEVGHGRRDARSMRGVAPFGRPGVGRPHGAGVRIMSGGCGLWGRAGCGHRCRDACDQWLTPGKMQGYFPPKGSAWLSTRSWHGFQPVRPMGCWPGRSTSTGCRPTSPSSWTGTAAGPPDVASRVSRDTRPASTPFATSSKPRSDSGSTC